MDRLTSATQQKKCIYIGESFCVPENDRLFSTTAWIYNLMNTYPPHAVSKVQDTTMRSSTVLCVAVTSAGFLTTAWASTNSTLDALVTQSSANLVKILEDRKTQNSSATCNSDTVVVRKEWATLTTDEKLTYISAVKCLISSSPGLTPLSAAPGVRSRFDDFGALHVSI